MERLIVLGLVFILSACAGIRVSVHVEEEGFSGANMSRKTRIYNGK